MLTAGHLEYLLCGREIAKTERPGLDQMCKILYGPFERRTRVPIL